MKTINLTKNAVAIVDDEDFEHLSKWKWHLSVNGYAARRTKKINNKSIMVYMHRVLMKLHYGDKEQVDHADMDKLNNQKTNLRFCNKSTNSMNRLVQKNNLSGFKGVSYIPKKKRWFARIMVDRKVTYLGMYKTPEEAHLAYKNAADRLHNEFANY